MAHHVILLTDAHEPPAAELTEALQVAGVVAFIEVLREVELDAPNSAHLDQRRAGVPGEFEPVPLAVLYEVVPGTDLVEIYAAVEHALSSWPTAPLVACRRPFTGIQRHSLRTLESSTLRRLGFRAVADEPAQLPALLRKIEERGGTGELRLPTSPPSPYLVNATPLPLRLNVAALRSAFELVASLHFAADQRSAAYTAIEGLRQLIECDRWTVYLASESPTSPGVVLDPLAVRTRDRDIAGLPDDDWRRLLLSDAMVATGPVSSAASSCVMSGETCRTRRNGSYTIAVPLVSEDRVMGVLEARREQKGARSFTRPETALLESIASPVASALANSLRIAEAERLSQTDDLTKLHNARYLRQFLTSEVKRARRYGSCVSALFLDLDNFKKINDENGHLAGSHVLMEMATIILSSVRDTDIVARYGGDEFVVVLPETGIEQATHVADRIRKKIAGSIFTGGRRLELRLTASFGIASFPEHAQSPQQLVACADTAMYEAKAHGKNRISISADTMLVRNDENAISQ
jgi:diguanylate cyclase (GGDEF)-like protein